MPTSELVCHLCDSLSPGLLLYSPVEGVTAGLPWLTPQGPSSPSLVSPDQPFQLRLLLSNCTTLSLATPTLTVHSNGSNSQSQTKEEGKEEENNKRGRSQSTTIPANFGQFSQWEFAVMWKHCRSVNTWHCRGSPGLGAAMAMAAMAWQLTWQKWSNHRNRFKY